MQHVGMADQHRCSGILQHIIDFLGLEVPIDRYRIGAEPHRGIGRFDEGDIVAHQDADAVALLDAKPLQTAGDAVGAIGDLGVAPFAIAADDAAERWGCVGHCLVRFWRTARVVVITGKSAKRVFALDVR